jgi:hypothetical protein
MANEDEVVQHGSLQVTKINSTFLYIQTCIEFDYS